MPRTDVNHQEQTDAIGPIDDCPNLYFGSLFIWEFHERIRVIKGNKLL